MTCACGCGQQTGMIKVSRTRGDARRGDYSKFRPGHNMHNAPGVGYVSRHGVRVHVRTAQTAIGKALPAGAVVHHVDGNPRNNTNANLVICQDQRYHVLLHARARIVKAGGNPNTQKICCTCKQLKDRTWFSKRLAYSQVGLQGRCRECVKRAGSTRFASQGGS